MSKHKKEGKKDKNARKVEQANGQANGKSELIDRLNYALSLEFAATIQYMNQQCVVVGHDRQDFAPFFAASSTEAHLHAQNLGNKIVALGGIPTIQPAEIKQAQSLRQMLEYDLEMESEALDAYVKAWEAAEGNRPLRFWLENIIQEEQLHVDELGKLVAERS